MGKGALFAGMTCLLAATTLLADCVDGAHRTTAAERAYFVRFYAAAEAALPPPPAGWERTDDGAAEPPDYLCGERPQLLPFADYRADYERTEGKAEREALLEAEIAASLQPDEAQAARIAELTARHEALMQRMEALLQTGDYAALEPLQAEAEANGAAMDALFAGVTDRVAASTETHRRDTRAEIDIVSDRDQFWTNGGEPLPPHRGAPVFRFGGDGEYGTTGWQEGRTVLLLGRWERDRHEPEMLRARGDAVAITVTADRARAAALLTGMDLDALRALLR